MATAVYRQLVTLLLLFASAGTLQQSWAHAILMDSTPKSGSTVQGTDLAISLRFNVRIDKDRSHLRLVSPRGTTSVLALASQSGPDTVQAHMARLTPGAYKIEWQVLASDGHMSRGEIPFTVN